MVAEPEEAVSQRRVRRGRGSGFDFDGLWEEREIVYCGRRKEEIKDWGVGDNNWGEGKKRRIRVRV